MTALLLARSDGFFEIMTEVFRRPDTLAHPEVLLRHLQELSIIWSAIFLAAGLACLIQGYKYYKIVTVCMALLIGALVGYGLGKRIEDHYIVAACIASLLAVCCWPLMKYAVAVMGGLAGAFVGANVWSAAAAWMSTRSGAPRIDPAHQSYWVGALIGLIVCGMLTFIVFKVSVVFFTSVSGATIALFGVMALLLQVPSWEGGIRDAVNHNAVLMPLMVIVPAIIGLIYQQVEPATGGGGAGGARPVPAKA